MDASTDPQKGHGIMDEDAHLCGSSSSSESSVLSMASLSDFSDDATSPVSSLDLPKTGPLYEMSSLMEQLPFRRGLSKHFHGKSQSFASLSNVSCLEDLAKRENPYKKRLKSCKSYGGDLDSHRPYSPKASSRTISKKASRGSCSSLHAKSNGFLNIRPPMPSHRTSNLCNQTPLFV